MATLMCGKTVFFFEHGKPPPRGPLGQGEGGRQPDDPATDNRDVVRFLRHVASPSIPAGTPPDCPFPAWRSKSVTMV
jgi:hypothetical protein